MEKHQYMKETKKVVLGCARNESTFSSENILFI